MQAQCKLPQARLDNLYATAAAGSTWDYKKCKLFDIVCLILHKDEPEWQALPGCRLVFKVRPELDPSPQVKASDPAPETGPFCQKT